MTTMADPNVLAERYVLGEVLGKGGMGTVYAAHDRVLGREVAVKLLDVANAPVHALERFRREGQLLAGLSHPNIVTIFDFGTDEHTAWLVMELLPGPTLERLLADQGPLRVERVISYGKQCATALAAAHAAGITHRDVKPANLMLAGDGRCVLVDLGIARLAGATTSAQPALTQTGLILGSVAFVAPEVITGGIPGPQADLYALGAVLFSLLTGHPPFAGDTSAATLGQHVYAPPPRPRRARADTPAVLDDLVVCLLAKDPDSRPDATAVVATLARTDVAEGAVDMATAPMPVPGTATTSFGAEPPQARTRMLTTSAPMTVGGSGRRRTRRSIALLAALVAAAAAVAGLLATSNNEPSPTAHPALTSSTAQPSPTSAQTPTPTPAITTAAPSPTVVTSPTAAASSSSSAEALAALASAITSVADSGELDGKQAKEAQRWVDDFNRELGKSDPQDLGNRVDELDGRLSDYRDQEQLSSAGYDLLKARLDDLRNTL